MFGWLEKKFSKSQRDEADRFLVSLQGADPSVIDMICGMTIFWAAFYRKNGLDLYEMERWVNLKENMTFPLQLGQQIKMLQKHGTTSSVPGLMVWLISARAFLYPELRLGGRQIWNELSRSSSEAEKIAIECISNMRLALDPINHLRVPEGLEKLDR